MLCPSWNHNRLTVGLLFFAVVSGGPFACLETSPRGGLLGLVPGGLFAQEQPPSGDAEKKTRDRGKLVPISPEDDKAITIYADAANFQTGGAIDLAIEQWKKFLSDYPDHSLAAKAAHYLGVCYMQQESPDYEQAAGAFAMALKNQKYDLREESLTNQGWCLYAAAGSGANVRPEKLEAVLQTYQTLREEFPETRFLDRAWFYSGEAAYGLKRVDEAISHYSRMLSLPSAKNSPLRCDALYARGVALEESQKIQQAMASYKQLVESCDDKSLVTDVYLRLGDLRILRKDFDGAVKTFELAFESAPSDDDKAYAIFRQAFSLVQLNQPKRAAEKYAQLADEYPQSAYATSAVLASAQSLYRSGDNEQAAKQFAKVIATGDRAPATEAAHWIARIAIAAGDHDQAIDVARAQLDRGAAGDYAAELKMDLAESLSLGPDTIAESLQVFQQVYRDDPDGKLAPRALYNAAFSALQVGELVKASELTNEFIKRFPDNTLFADVQFVSAESLLGQGKSRAAADQYRRLLADASRDDVQRPAWIMRAGTALVAAKDFDGAVELLQSELEGLKQSAQKADAYFLIGQAQMAAGRMGDASKAFGTAFRVDPKGNRAGEAKLLQGKAVATTDPEQATRLWQQIIAENPDKAIAQQARYKLGELAASRGDHDDAIGLYQQILASEKDPGLKPYAQYGIGFSQIQTGDFQDAVATLDELINGYPHHALRNDVLLSRGVAHRNLQNSEAARKDLETFLVTDPHGENLGHSLYELALVDLQQEKSADAIKRLRRIIDEVPGFPAMEKVVYELGWALQEAGDQQAAAEQFTALVQQFPQSPGATEAAYFLGQRFYADEAFDRAAKQFQFASQSANAAMKEKAIYRVGWSRFKQGNFDEAESAFKSQVENFPEGQLSFDGQLMIGESRFKKANYRAALDAYRVVRENIQKGGQSAETVRDPAQRQARALALLHGGQSAAQVGSWTEALQWYDELRERFPATSYIEQVFFETGFAYQQLGNEEKALKFFDEVAANFRDSLAARARFMMGEIHFAANRFDQAIPEFQRVMFGFGAGQAPDAVKNWQAKSGFEAARCSEVLSQQAKTEAAKAKAVKIAAGFYRYVTEKHPQHELAEKALARLNGLGNRL